LLSFDGWLHVIALTSLMTLSGATATSHLHHFLSPILFFHSSRNSFIAWSVIVKFFRIKGLKECSEEFRKCLTIDEKKMTLLDEYYESLISSIYTNKEKRVL